MLLFRKAAPLFGLTALAAIGLTAAPAANARATSNIAILNPVDNPGFETGDFTEWTTTDASQGSDLFVSNTDPNSGSYAANFGASTPGDFDSISQEISTIPGDNYTVLFYLENLGTDPEFMSSFAGVTGFDTTDPNPFPYTQESFTETATGPTSLLQFSGYNTDGLYGLDDVAVINDGPAPTPEPSQTAALGVGVLLLAGLILKTRKRRLA